MPYIDQIARKRLDLDIQNIYSVGELNYAITKLCNEFIRLLPKSYENYNAIIGVLESAKLEYYRRQVAIYEDQKKEINGDVYN